MENPVPFERRRRATLALAAIGLTAITLAAIGVSSIGVDAPSHSQTTPNKQEVKGEHSELYPVHKDITATMFWVGEPADNTNDYIHNSSSAWVDDWQSAYGGVDDPNKRCGDNQFPCDFTPKENPYYFALPYSDLTDSGVRKESANNIPWYDKVMASNPNALSVVKNQWIKVTLGDKVAYAQWEDAGPFYYDDFDYVFGTGKQTSQRAGLDLSPATATFINLDGRAKVSWQFVDETEVPEGPWRTIITHSN